MKNNQLLAYGLALLNATIIGFSFLFTKVALEDATPIDTLAYRFSIAFIVILIIWAVKPNLINFHKLKRGNIGFLLLLALFYPTLFFSFQTFGLLFSSSAEGGIIFAFSPVVTTLFADIFLKERTTKIQLLFISLSVFGVVYIFAMNGAALDISHAKGLVLLILSCMAIAGYTVISRFLSVSYSPIQLSFVMVFFGFVFFNAYALISHGTKGDIGQFIDLMTNQSFMVANLFLGVLATIVTSVSGNYILSKIPASQMSVFFNLSTVVSIVAGAIFLGEKVAYYHWLGTAIIIAGVIGTNRFARRHSLPKVGTSTE